MLLRHRFAINVKEIRISFNYLSVIVIYKLETEPNCGL
jgi:hypothetical protein